MAGTLLYITYGIKYAYGTEYLNQYWCLTTVYVPLEEDRNVRRNTIA